MDSCTQVIDVAGGWRLPEAFQSPDVELQAAKKAVVLGDDTSRGKILVQGEDCARAARQAFGAAPDAVGTWVEAEGVEFDPRGRIDLTRSQWRPRSTAPPAERGGK